MDDDLCNGYIEPVEMETVFPKKGTAAVKHEEKQGKQGKKEEREGERGRGRERTRAKAMATLLP